LPELQAKRARLSDSAGHEKHHAYSETKLVEQPSLSRLASSRVWCKRLLHNAREWSNSRLDHSSVPFQCTTRVSVMAESLSLASRLRPAAGGNQGTVQAARIKAGCGRPIGSCWRSIGTSDGLSFIAGKPGLWQEGGGALAADLQRAFPGVGAFSSLNCLADCAPFMRRMPTVTRFCHRP